ncbi:MAG TPA: helix-turn-helix transcriptional regulator [Gaiellaceae bacterium]|nr:helix-turn-helix transcriptional regulator [Gaiellaceae bacterium]
MSVAIEVGTRRQELAAFVRSRRERLLPEEVGLPRLRRRRTPGLRREEVAQLAGVGVTWYTWLEQGRDINPSPQVLEAIARTLRFDPHERTHLFTLAGVPLAPAEIDVCETLFPTARTLLSSLEPNPAVLMNARWDLLAYNRMHASFFSDLDSIPREDRNCIWLAFTDPEWRDVIVDWDEVAGRMVGEYRAAMAEHVDDPSWRSFVERLLEASPEFSARWQQHDVRRTESARKRVRHPELGVLTLDYTNLWLDASKSARIVAFTPPDEHTAARLRAFHQRRFSMTSPPSDSPTFSKPSRS